MNSSLKLLNVPNGDAIEFALEVNYEFSSNFADGKLDGENNFEPILYQWCNLDYRQGYLIGMAKRLGIEYALIHDLEINQIIFV